MGKPLLGQRLIEEEGLVMFVHLESRNIVKRERCAERFH
jgi:hypothetical protein